MDRRDLFKTIAGVAAGAGVVSKVQIADASERTVPALAILECDDNLSPAAVVSLGETWEQAIADTPMRGMKLIVLTRGSRLTLLDAQGRVLNRDISQADDRA